MPAASTKKAKKSTKVMKAAKAAPRKKVTSVSKASKSSNVPWYNKPYFLEEQEQFHKEHPSAKTLIWIFIICMIVFFGVLYMSYLQ